MADRRGSVGLYLLGMDTLYDLQQGIYANNTAGVLELVIDLLLATASLSAPWWSWHNRRLLLNPPSGREPTADHLAPSTPGP